MNIQSYFYIAWFMNMPKCVNIRCIFVDLCVCVLYALCSSSFFKVASTSRLNAKMAEKQLFFVGVFRVRKNRTSWIDLLGFCWEP